MLQNTRFTALTVSELLRENQESGVKLPPTQTGTELGLNILPLKREWTYFKKSMKTFLNYLLSNQ